MGSTLSLAGPAPYNPTMGDHAAQALSDEEAELEALRRAVEEGIAAADAGRVVSHERVRAWLLDLAHGKYADPPEPE